MSTHSYRPDIDGLRAVAVWLVVLFHAFPQSLPGGFVGVDVFFVISGYLITGIIAREIQSRQFSLAIFYERRIRRIFPALIIVLVASVVAGGVVMLPSVFAQLGSDVFASGFFAANVALYFQSGYFDLESAKKPLLHLWSLGIEEQFYLTWPLALMLCRSRRRQMLKVCIVLLVISFGANVLFIHRAPVGTFYLPVTRAWELLAGAALALGPTLSLRPTASTLRAMAGAVMITVAVIALDPDKTFPGWWAVLPVLGSALIVSAPSAWGNVWLLSSPVAVWFGKISYPFYLWHWPILVFAAMAKFRELTPAERGLSIGLSIFLAWVTYRLVERPIRFGFKQRSIIAAAAGAMSLVALIGGMLVLSGGLPGRLPSDIRSLASLPTQQVQWRVGKCLLELSKGKDFAAECVDRSRPLIFLWGDSTAAALMPGLRAAQSDHEFGIAQFTASSCAPVLDDEVIGGPRCVENNKKVLRYAQELQPNIILLHAVTFKPEASIVDTVRTLRQTTGARIVVLGTVPDWRRGLPNEVLRHYMLHRELMPVRSNGDVDQNELATSTQDRIRRAGGEYQSATRIFCNNGGCLSRGDKLSDLFVSDNVHLTEKGSEYLVRSIIKPLLQAGPS